jgi:hypothetical protein
MFSLDEQSTIAVDNQFVVVESGAKGSLWFAWLGLIPVARSALSFDWINNSQSSAAPMEGTTHHPANDIHRSHHTTAELGAFVQNGKKII